MLRPDRTVSADTALGWRSINLLRRSGTMRPADAWCAYFTAGDAQFYVQPGDLQQIVNLGAQVRIKGAERFGQVVAGAHAFQISLAQQLEHPFGTLVQAVFAGPQRFEAAFTVEGD